jgi:hypothetical protein
MMKNMLSLSVGKGRKKKNGSVSSAVILFGPKFRLVWILWCKISVILCDKCLRQRYRPNAVRAIFP